MYRTNQPTPASAASGTASIAPTPPSSRRASPADGTLARSASGAMPPGDLGQMVLVDKASGLYTWADQAIESSEGHDGVEIEGRRPHTSVAGHPAISRAGERPDGFGERLSCICSRWPRPSIPLAVQRRPTDPIQHADCSLR